eukprot:Blabericola_migrator_1__6080@NODE_306_length_10090_cov_155_786691_g250_i0_p3_GENE_NODE_306_length_10090_cov_155_786691_g250_i0NODE_306_length_10090_cov_155_786691_g250_i0_p3_ORF_typecomplete_len472_score107_39DUF2465/PF10239_9/2_6e25NYDSP28_assoc/PF14775_6/0_017_NODE_306_length_10090_cov_155_786691_g250_i0858510000
MWPTLEDLHDIIKVTYKSINGRHIHTAQQTDILAMLSTDCFPSTYDFMIGEMDPSRMADIQTVSDVVKDAEARGYLECRPIVKAIAPTVKERCSILYEALIDLQCERLKTNSVGATELIVQPRCEELEAEQREMLETKLAEIEKALKLPVDKSLSPEDRLAKIATEDTMKKWKELDATLKGYHHLLVPYAAKKLKNFDALNQLLEKIRNEYSSRLSVMLMRLEVTAQAFLYSDRAKTSYEEICSLLSALNAWIEDHKVRNALSVYDLMSAPKSLLTPDKISSRTIPSALKKIQVGNVPNRGGVPEGFAALDVKSDVQKANVALQQKDAREMQAKKRAEAEWVGGAAAVVNTQASKKSVWRAPAGSAQSVEQSRQAATSGGPYNGFTVGYEKSGRRRFPGYRPEQPPYVPRDQLPDDLPYIGQPKGRPIIAPTVAQSQRVVRMDAPMMSDNAIWGGRTSYDSVSGWDPRQFR